MIRVQVLLTASLGLASPLAAGDGDLPVMLFEVLETAPHLSARLDNGLRLVVAKTELGWEAGVFRGLGKDNLLYPSRRWHGAFSCQLSAWSHGSAAFPDVRVVPIRGHSGRLVLDLSQAKSAGEGDEARFTGGRIRIAWRKP